MHDDDDGPAGALARWANGTLMARTIDNDSGTIKVAANLAAVADGCNRYQARMVGTASMIQEIQERRPALTSGRAIRQDMSSGRLPVTLLLFSVSVARL